MEAITFAALSLSSHNIGSDDADGDTSNDISLPISESVIPQCFDCSAELNPTQPLDDDKEEEELQDVRKPKEPNVDLSILPEQCEEISQAYKVP